MINTEEHDLFDWLAYEWRRDPSFVVMIPLIPLCVLGLLLCNLPLIVALPLMVGIPVAFMALLEARYQKWRRLNGPA